MTGPVDRELARRAAPQHGCLTRAELVAAGLDASAIDYRLRIGRLHRVHRAVYAVGYVAPSPHTYAMAAILACGEGDQIVAERRAKREEI